MKPFLLLQSRPEDDTSDNEFEAFVRYSGLTAEDFERRRIEHTGIDFPINLDNYSGIMLGGGPMDVSDLASDEQRKMLKDLHALLDDVVAQDFPFFGACLGIGVVGSHQGCVIGKEKYSEDVGGKTIIINEEGKKDPLLQGLPENFRAFLGHKEACQELAPHAVLLASSETCPVQMFRIGENVYATQFHPELDEEGLIVRIRAYKHKGYFPPEDADKVIARAQKETITVPQQILKNFVNRYKRD